MFTLALAVEKETGARLDYLSGRHDAPESGTNTGGAHSGGPEPGRCAVRLPERRGRTGVSPTTPCYCSQDHLEPVLLEHLRTHDGRIRFGTELTGFTTDGTGADATLHHRASGRTERIRARYLIGADGLHSTVRTGLGIGLDDLGTVGEYVAVTFRADLTRRLPRLPAVLNLVEIASGAGLFMPTSIDDQWIYGCERHPERGESITDLSPQWCTELIRAGAGLPDLQPEILPDHAFRHDRAGRHGIPGRAGVSRR